MELHFSAASSQLKEEEFKFNRKLPKYILNNIFLLSKNKQIKKKDLPVPVGVHVACATIGETVGELRPAGDDPSGNRGLVMLPRLQSRKRPL